MQRFFILFTFCLFFVTKISSQKTSFNSLFRPKLVVGIVIDQMRYDYLYRYWDKYSEDGFKKLLREGYSFDNTHYNYVPTYTAPGHASIYTGTTPAVHGIIGNDWFSRENAKNIYCVSDETVTVLNGSEAAGKMSPANLLTTTVGDEIRLESNMNARVIGIALKDRAAILPAGHTANAAYWFDAKTGNWISSSYYFKKIPNYVTIFNAQNLPKKYMSQSWNTLLPMSQYTESTEDDTAYEGLFEGETKPVFPHNLSEIYKKSGAGAIATTPYGNTLTKDFAIATLEAERLGKGKFTDMLTVSFSAPDLVGHKFGPNSIETEDTYLRLDLELADFLKYLDKNIGKKNVLVFLTADHGVIQVPKFLSDRKIPTGKFRGKELMDSLSLFLAADFGDSLVSQYINQQIYLNHNLINQRKINVTNLENKIINYLLTCDGVSNVVSAISLQTQSFQNTVFQRVQNGFHPRRSGDIAIQLFPGWIDSDLKTSTTHGSSYTYDTHVPLLWYGWKIPSGSSEKAVEIIDIAPTISNLLHIAFPNGATGNPLNFNK